MGDVESSMDTWIGHGGALINGDCFDHMKRLPDHCVDMILCDLPYGTTACSWDSVLPLGALWAEYKRVSTPVDAGFA